MKRLGCVNHGFPSLEDVRGAACDWLCKNVVVRFLMKFWIEGEGRALAFDEAAAGTHEVRCGFSLVVVCRSFPFLFILLMILFILFADTALGRSDLCWRN